MSDTVAIALAGAILALLVMAPYLIAHRRRETRTHAERELAVQHGLHEPATLHPVVDPGACIGTGNCVSVCPEGTVLGFSGGQAVVIAPARCIGHGLCERSCPVDAITLMVGSDRRGVDIPRIQENFETNVPGIYVVGELGGMGLIGNAFEQGRQCVEGILRERARSDAPLDALVVGCGPAGLATSLHLLHRAARFATLERDDVGGTVRHYPRKKLVLTRPVQVPGFGRLDVREIAKEDLVDVWLEIVQRTGLCVRTGETVQRIERLGDGGFRVHSDSGDYHTQRVVLAIGRRGVPRRLGVPGEDTGDVLYSLREPEAYQYDRVMVVGGGDAAVEAALALAAQPGNVVRISYRGAKFSRLKDANCKRIEAAESAGAVQIFWSTNVARIGRGSVLLEDAVGARIDVPADRVFVMIGGELPTEFLRACGVEVETKFGTPLRARR